MTFYTTPDKKVWEQTAQHILTEVTIAEAAYYGKNGDKATNEVPEISRLQWDESINTWRHQALFALSSWGTSNWRTLRVYSTDEVKRCGVTTKTINLFDYSMIEEDT